ncbi:hypothetical protein [Microbacterium sp. No. 7]|uniref:hypothetical protein n=1 Tax=Microbacterium sp. No. 7 TaxID=1714373 RepID=UPI0012E28CB3|nr:hypothetical protein [Microbacterium sp. No. 7]
MIATKAWNFLGAILCNPLKKMASIMSTLGRPTDRVNVIDQQDSHDALFTSPTIHFTMTSHAGGPIDLEFAVRRLFRADIAVAAAWPSESGVRLTPKMRSLVKVIRSGERLRDDVADLRSGKSFAAAARFAWRHPRLVTNALRRRWSRSAAVDAPVVDAADSGADSLDGALSMARKVIVDAQKIAAAEHQIDETLFGGASRIGDDFVRLILRGSYHDLRIPGVSETAHAAFEPRLLIHRCGVVQLTIALPIHREMTTAQLVEIARSDRAVLVRSEIPEPLLIGLPVKRLLGEWRTISDAGARLRAMEFPDSPTMADSLERHFGAVGTALGVPLPREWNTHATVMAAMGHCCGSAELWQVRHKDAIARVATRFDSDANVNLDRLSGADLSVSADHQLYTNLGSTTRIQLIGAPPEPIRDLDTVLIVEHTLVQYFRLRNLESAVTGGALYGKKLERAYAEAIKVLADMRQQEIRFGSARQIATRLLTDLGGEEMRRTVETALDLSSQANATRSANTQASRSLRLAWIATILAALVAVPALRDLLDYVSEVDTSTVIGKMLFPLRLAADTGEWGPWVVLASLAAILVSVWLLGRATKLPAVLRRCAECFRRRRSWLPADLKLHVESERASRPASDAERLSVAAGQSVPPSQ